MSSHKEAPAISNDAAADNTDVYVFVSPDKPNTVTLIANFVPLEDPAGGPNFFEFGDDVLYEIHIVDNATADARLTYQFTFTTRYQNPKTFLYNTGPIDSLNSANWNRRQFATVKKVVGGTSTTLGTDLPCPPCNIGPRSTPNYPALATAAIHQLDSGETVFTGQRAEGFYVDLGAIFDLGVLRPFASAHLIKMPQSTKGVNSTKAKNIHSIAIQVPKTALTADGVAPTDPTKPNSTIGVYASASRQANRIYNPDGTVTDAGPFVQISRLANPLFNEVLIPIPLKDKWNSQAPSGDSQFAKFVANPELANLLPVLYPGVFPNLAKLDAAKTNRDDLLAILLTGIPAGVVPGFQNFTSAVQADLLRLNMAIAPKTTNPSNLGLVGGDAAGFPNGRRVFDDVTTIELRALAGTTYKLTHPSYVPDAAAGAVTPGLTSGNTDVTASNTVNYLSTFPYLGTPHSGYNNPSDNFPAPDLGALNVCTVQVPIPVGPPQTGQGLITSPGNRDALIAGGIAVAGAAVAAGIATRPRTQPAGGPEDDAAAYSGTAAPDDSASSES
ncbi:MAG: hypothetical protein DLM57_07840 [Pseudonocardiales bacterium]|nr:MAG: hypothetical protein DLM57_07840 [Pseudonocardiales bacterium]